MKNIFLLILAIAIESCKPELHNVHFVLLNDHEMMVNDNKINIDNFGKVFSLEILNSQKGSGADPYYHIPLVKHLQKRASGGYEPAEKWHEMESRASMTARLFAVYSPSSIFLNSFSFSIQSIGVSRFRSRSSRASLILPAVGSAVSNMLSW